MLSKIQFIDKNHWEKKSIMYSKILTSNQNLAKTKYKASTPIGEAPCHIYSQQFTANKAPQSAGYGTTPVIFIKIIYSPLDMSTGTTIALLLQNWRPTSLILVSKLLNCTMYLTLLQTKLN